MSTKHNFRVIIAGGGIAGLTLANSLQKANIDYLILEGRNEIAPRVGASIAISANGGRVLDQLGIYEELVPQILGATFTESWKDGRLLASDDLPQLGTARSGYPVAMLDRQPVLQKMYDAISDKSKVLLEKRVSRVDHSKDGVVVQCKDGTSYEGAIVVAADGVHSLVRQEMWRQANLAEPETFPEDQLNLLTSEYTCVFGVSKPIAGLTEGGIYKDFHKDTSILIITGKDNRTFWFVFSKMDKVHRVPNIPRFTTQDAEAQIELIMKRPVTDRVVWADIWAQRESFKLVPLEEALFSKWTWGRFVCLGDSIHKMTPNIGQGGNNAIESAAALANSLEAILRNKLVDLPYESIEKSLEAFQSHREARVKAILTVANKVTRLEALAGPIETFFALYIVPNSGEFFQNSISHVSIGSEKLNYLPDPERSLVATMGFNQNFGAGHEESRLKRALIALPLLALAYFCHKLMDSIINGPVMPQLVSSLVAGKLDFGATKTFVLATSYYSGISWLEGTFWPLIIAFSPSLLNIDPAQRLQAISFLTDLAPLYLIWLLESHRRANTLAFARIPLVFGLAFQLYGIGRVAPIYYFFHFVQSPPSQFAGLDRRLVNVAAARTALFAVIIAFSLPTFAMYCLPSLAARLQVNAIWQLFPVLVSATHYLLRKYTVTDTTRHDRIHNPSTDLPSIRVGVYALAIISALTFNWIRFTSSYSLSTIFFPSSAALWTWGEALKTMDLVSGMGLFLSIDYLSCFAASFAWLALLFKDLKETEMEHQSWSKLLLYVVAGTYIAGPGAVFGLAWLHREEILASKKAKGAVVRKN